jgi:hypothetical protein
MQNTNLIYSDNAILVSKASALRTIIDLLNINDIETILSARNSSYHSSDRFIVKWFCNYNGMGCEETISLTDNTWSSVDGAKAVHSTQGIFHEFFFKWFATIEMSLIHVGAKLAKNINASSDVKQKFNDFAISYNKRMSANNILPQK